MANTRGVVLDYIKFRLDSNGMKWNNSPSDKDTSDPINDAIRKHGEEFEQKYKSDLDDLIANLELTEDNACEQFFKTVKQLFANKEINWGRIIALFSFSGKFAVECHNKEISQVVDSLAEWTISYIEIVLASWISSNRGWEALIQKKEEPEQAAVEIEETVSWFGAFLSSLKFPRLFRSTKLDKDRSQVDEIEQKKDAPQVSLKTRSKPGRYFK